MVASPSSPPSLPWFESGRFPLFLAPMAGYTDFCFRQLCKQEGADVMVTEFVMADAFLRQRATPKVWDTVDFSPDQRPMGVQLFGSRPEAMAEAARIICDRLQPDFIDLNFGCPSPRVCALQAGSSLLRDIPAMARLAAAVVRALPATPVTAKIRLGWDSASIVALEAGAALQDAGIRALTIHGRTRQQAYSGTADWSTIAEVADHLSLPVVGNGDIRSATDVLRVRTQTRVAGVMIGRGALGYPWIFREIKASLATGQTAPAIPLQARWDTILSYAEDLLSRPFQQQRSPSRLGWMRSKLMFFFRQLPGSRKLRVALTKVQTLEDLRQLALTHLSNTPCHAPLPPTRS